MHHTHHGSATCVTSALIAVKSNGLELKSNISSYSQHMQTLAESPFVREMGKLRSSIIN